MWVGGWGGGDRGGEPRTENLVFWLICRLLGVINLFLCGVYFVLSPFYKKYRFSFVNFLTPSTPPPNLHSLFFIFNAISPFPSGNPFFFFFIFFYIWCEKEEELAYPKKRSPRIWIRLEGGEFICHYLIVFTLNLWIL